MPITTCVFDAYGTLFDVAAAARQAAAEPGREALAEHWPKLAEHWRLKQLQYHLAARHHGGPYGFLGGHPTGAGLGPGSHRAGG